MSEEQLESAKSGPLNEVQIGMASRGIYDRSQLKNESEILDSLLSLNTLGLLIGDTRKLGMPYGGRFVITGYGQEFSKFIQNSLHDSLILSSKE